MFRRNHREIQTFFMPITKENENIKTVTRKMKFIDRVRLMSSSPSSLANNPSKGLNKDKCKNCRSDLEYMTVNDGSFIFKFVDCKKLYDKEFHEDLPKTLTTHTDSVKKTLTHFV